MIHYVALLRGINVGGRVVKMADLKACLEEQLGLQQVSTLLQSGNVRFTSAMPPEQLKSDIEAILSKTFDYPAKVQVLRLDDLRRIVEKYPFETNDETKQYYVVFMENALEARLRQESGHLESAAETAVFARGVIYWQVPKGMTLKSNFAKYLTKAAYKDFNTVRNIKTLRKLLEQS